MHVYQRQIHAEGDDSLSRIARLVPAGSRVLDVGCGSGALGRYLSANLGCSVDGVTHNPDEAAEAATGHRSVKVLDLDTQAPSSAFEGASYDVIVCADVLEHVRRSEAVLQDLHALLAPKGKVLLSLPNVTHAGVVLSLISGKFVPTYEGLLDATHLHFFDRDAVERLAAQAGFGIVHLERVLRSLPQTEFGALNADALPPAVREFLLSGDEGSTYQFIAELQPLAQTSAQPTQQPSQLPLPTRPVIAQKPQFAAQIYWRADGAYLEECSAYAFGEIGCERQTLTFTLPANTAAVNYLRVDAADRPGVFELWGVTVLDRQGAPLWSWDTSYHQAMRLNGMGYVASAQSGTQSVQTFVATNDDPWLELPLPAALHDQLGGASVRLEMSWPRTADYAAFSYADSAYQQRLALAAAHSTDLAQALLQEQEQRAISAAHAAEIAQALLQEQTQRSREQMARETEARQLLVRIQSHEVTIQQLQFTQAELRGAALNQSQQLAALRAELQTAGDNFAVVSNELKVTNHKLQETTAQLLRVESQLNTSSSELHQVKGELATSRSIASYREQDIQAIYRSRSWRFSKPLRGIERMARFLRSKVIEPKEPTQTGYSLPVEVTVQNAVERNASVNRNNSGDLSDFAVNTAVELSSESLANLESQVTKSALIDEAPPIPLIEPTEQPGSGLIGLQGSVDRLLVHEQAVYAVGWYYHPHYSIIGAWLVFGDPKMPKQRLELRLGTSRPDVQQTHPHWLNAGNTGWFVYGGINAEANCVSELYLSLQLSSREVILLDVTATVGAHLTSKGRQSLISESQPTISDLFTVASQSTTLIIDHSMGGGANLASSRLIDEIVSQQREAMTLTFDVSALNYRLKLHKRGFILDITLSTPGELLSYAAQGRFERLVFNNAVSFPHSQDVPTWLLALARAARASLTIYIHDYFVICPSNFLLDNTGSYCDIPSYERCRSCLPAIVEPMVRLYNGAGIEAWRNSWADCLELAEQVICFSESSKRLLIKAYPQLSPAKISLIPHRITAIPVKNALTSSPPSPPNPPSPPSPPSPRAAANELRLGVVGHISDHKGAQVVERLRAAARARGLDFSITVVGTFEPGGGATERLFESDGNFHVTGPYAASDLALTLAAHRVNLVLFPSICPETFSYVLHELRALDMPIVAFDLGAQADIVKQAHNGLLLPLALINAAEELLVSIVQFSETLAARNTSGETPHN